MMTLHCRSFAYDDGAVLSGVDLTVAAGELVTVVGASGSGKTTVARLLAGQTGVEAGARLCGFLELAGERLDFAGTEEDPRIDPAVWSAQVGFVAQNAWAQLSMMCGTVGEEIAFGLANRGVPADRMHSIVDKIAERLTLGTLLERDPRRLSGGQLQKTILAAALASDPGLLVLDEPLQGLDSEARAEVTAVLSVLRADGTAVVVFEPLLPPADDLGGRVVALAGGRTVFSGSPVEAQSAGLGRYGIGPHCLGGHPPGAGHVGAGSMPRPRAEAVATLTGVQFEYPQQRPDGARLAPAPAIRRSTGLDRVDLSLHRGEAVALLGANGSGKSTLLQHLNGLLRPRAGTVSILGQNIEAKVTGELVGTVGMLFQNTDQQLFERTVHREVSYGPMAAGESRAEAGSRAREALDLLQLSSIGDVHPHDLSFTQRRFVALASLMATRPLIWALDEPTAGLDDRGRRLLARIISTHVESGGAVLMATHDLGFAGAVCHRAVTLEQGRVAGGK